MSSMEERKILYGLDAKLYEHNFDKMALKTLQALPGFDTVANFFLNWGSLVNLVINCITTS